MKPEEMLQVLQIRAGEPVFPGLGKLGGHHELLCPPLRPTRRLASGSDSDGRARGFLVPPQGDPGTLEPGVRQEESLPKGPGVGRGRDAGPPQLTLRLPPGPLQNAQAGRGGGASTVHPSLADPPASGLQRRKGSFHPLDSHAGRDGQHPTLQIREVRHRKGRG